MSVERRVHIETAVPDGERYYLTGRELGTGQAVALHVDRSTGERIVSALEDGLWVDVEFERSLLVRARPTG